MLSEAEIKARLEEGELTLGMLEERKQSLLEASEEVKAISALENRSEVNQPTPNNTKPLKDFLIPSILKLQELVAGSSTPVNGLREIRTRIQ
jgi:hypothetical protein